MGHMGGLQYRPAQGGVVREAGTELHRIAQVGSDRITSLSTRWAIQGQHRSNASHVRIYQTRSKPFMSLLEPEKKIESCRLPSDVQERFGKGFHELDQHQKAQVDRSIARGAGLP